jgi:Alpha amylase, catalytic domain
MRFGQKNPPFVAKARSWEVVMHLLIRRMLYCVLLFFFVAALCGAQDFKKQVIYQIVTDRFFNGDTSNDNPSQSSGLFDATKTNWQVYWGGDLAGIQQKMAYIKGLGATAIWISPPVDNLNLNVPDSSGKPTAAYHGYQARDFKRIEEHFGDANNTGSDRKGQTEANGEDDPGVEQTRLSG